VVAECSGLILPSKYAEKKLSDKGVLKARVNKQVDRFLDDHQHIDHPYFILMKANNQGTHMVGADPNKISATLEYFEMKPPFITRTMVFWVDNSRGLITWLWRVTPDKKVIFNKTFAESCKDILRVKEPPS